MGNKKRLNFAVLMLMGFLVWTLLIKVVDVKPIGPDGSTVGFATVNSFIHNITGVNMTLYTITDWLGLVPFIIAFCFAVLEYKLRFVGTMKLVDCTYLPDNPQFDSKKIRKKDILLPYYIFIR